MDSSEVMAGSSHARPRRELGRVSSLQPMGKMEGLTALVTGASRGIGEEIAKRFAADGAHVFVTARTIDEGDHVFSGSITTTVQAIHNAGGSAEAVAADLGKADDRARVVATTGPIDVLVNNAAIT